MPVTQPFSSTVQTDAQTTLKDIGNKNLVAQPTLKESLEIAAREKQRMTLVYQNKVFLVAVPIEDVDLIEQLEDCLDTQAVKEAHERSDTPVPLEEAKKILGW